MIEKPLLTPQPKIVTPATGSFTPPDRAFILLAAPKPAELLFAAQRLQSAAGRNWEITASPGGKPSENAATLILDPDADLPSEGYTLDITPQGITLRAAQPAGIFYGVATLAQLLVQFPAALPAMSIRDWPDFPVRGVMLDISRDKVPTMQTLMELVDQLAGWKINHLELYTEHTFAYRNHKAVWEKASPMTGEEILLLDKYCSDRFIDLVPNQNSFSHMARWLQHEEYAHLANTHNRFKTPWGYSEGRVTLCPGDPGSIALIRDLYNELLPHFRSRYFNVGCDEAHDLSCERSKEAAEKLGVGRVYLDFLLRIYQEVKKHGRTMLFWDDIILRHPELVPEVPKDAIALSWGYEADHPFKQNAATLRSSGLEFWTCPGTSSWNSISGRTTNCIGNLRSAAVEGHAAGATGYLNTDWGDNGHWQHLPVSYLGFLYGASVSWNVADDASQLPDALSLHAFRDRDLHMGRLAYELGQVHEHFNRKTANCTILWQQLNRPLAELSIIEGTTLEDFDRADSMACDCLTRIRDIRMDRPNADLIRKEYNNTIAMIRLGCLLGRIRMKMKQGVDPSTEKAKAAKDLERLLAEYRPLWHARNRPGGFPESVARLEARRKELV